MLPSPAGPWHAWQASTVGGRPCIAMACASTDAAFAEPAATASAQRTTRSERRDRLIAGIEFLTRTLARRRESDGRWRRTLLPSVKASPARPAIGQAVDRPGEGGKREPVHAVAPLSNAVT